MQLYYTILRLNNEIVLLVTEKELIDRCCKGDALAQRELYELYAKPMYGVCCRYVKDREVAKDMLHDGFITLFTKIGDFRSEGSFEGWCRRIFVNTMLGYLRRHNPLNESDDIETNFTLHNHEASALEQMTGHEVLDCIDLLPQGYRTILNLFAIEGYSHKEVAQMMGISENTSRSQFSRARVRLAEILNERM